MISNLSNNYSQKIYTEEEFKKEQADTLKKLDANGDGKTTALELYKSMSDSYSHTFEENDTFTKRAEDIAQKQYEIFSRYAGADGVFDVNEYIEAMNSDENGVLVDEYWAMEYKQKSYNAEQEYINEASKALKQWDFNGDGKTTALELYKSMSDSYSHTFAGNDTFTKRAEDIAQKQYVIYSKYAGDDGVLNGKEYIEAITSDENSVLVDEYLKMEYKQKSYNTEQEYINEASKALKQWDFNGDGKTTALEMYKNISDTYSFVFEGNDTFSKRAQEIAQKQYEIYSKYAGDDGVLDGEEYAKALNSDENDILQNEYWEMNDSMEASKNGERIIGLSRHDSNRDGNVSVSELVNDKFDLYSNIFENATPELKIEALRSIITQSEILFKYAGDDGILSQEEYQNALSSESYGKSMEEYIQIKSQLDSLKES